MSQSSSATQGSGQIIIVRRGGDPEDAPHGGVWKIAFADFMTAMMAFFLVMWLTSVSDDATKKQIAQYFNPIKLNSAAPETLGLSDGKDTPPPPPPPTSANGEVKNGGNPNEKPMSGTATGGAEQALFRDPYAVLAEIAADGGPGTQNGLAGVPDGSGLPGLNGGEAYRDPFDPTSWQLQPNAAAKADTGTPIPPSEFDQAEAAADGPEKAAPVPTARPAGAAPVAPAVPDLPETTTVAELKTPPEPKVPDADADAEKAKALSAETAEAKALQAAIEKSIAATPSGSAPGVEVSAGKNGITISLADSLTSGMFEIGSAKPTAEAVRLVETIAKLLQERKGSVVIRGHTDSRPYSGVEYDNWRLSAARAQFAYYMLVRGGLDEQRVESIEGFADRQPKDAAHPESAVNRRIEILLKEPRP